MINDPKIVDALLQHIIPALEKQFGPVEYYTVCQNFEDSPDFQRIANIGLTTLCETTGCTNISANCCCFCTKAICVQCSHNAITEEGHEAFACADCIEEIL